jgi:transcriptional regulator with XRE-family HTH domain
MPWKRYSQQIALEVLEHLEENGFSQKYFAAQMGVSAQVVSKWLKGGENFTLETISKLEAVLGFDLIEVKEKVEIISRFETETFEHKEVYKKPPVSNTNIKMSAIVVQMQSSYLLAKTS